MPVFVRTGNHQGKPAVFVGNNTISLVVLPGGGHIAAIKAPGVHFNPLWEPPWKTTTPALRKAVGASFSQNPEDVLEGELLASICGHNLCCDVFGAHSRGEVRQGASFHGEAGLSTWSITQIVPHKSVTLEAHLTRSGLRISRTYAPDENEKPIVNVTETVENLLGVERVFGRAQHVSVGASMLEGSSCRFACNADRGLTWPEPTSTFRHNTSFKYPMIPTKGKASTDEAHCDWRQYPRGHPNSDLLTLRIRPQDKHGWFVAERTLADGGRVALGYEWERRVFPWLMTWEENCAREQAPWSGRTLVRGLEFSSYAFATTRRHNVFVNKLFGQPCFEWLDAGQEKTTKFRITLQRLPPKSDPNQDSSATPLPTLLGNTAVAGTTKRSKL